MSTATAFACPACGQPSLSIWRKLSLGPTRSFACPSCGSRLSVPWLPFAALMLFGQPACVILALLAAGPLLRVAGPVSMTTAASGFLLLPMFFLILLTWIYLRWTPLIMKRP